MKITFAVIRLLLGLAFCTFGLNGFMHFIKAPAPTGLAGQFANAMNSSSFYVLSFAVQLLAGLLLLLNRFVPFAVVLLGATIANILMFHIAMQPEGIVPGLVLLVLWCVVAYQNRSQLRFLFSSTAPAQRIESPASRARQ